jgi:hypothetical protein
MIIKIVSGGQTGVDRAALDTAIKLGLPHGGWIPKGRRTESGILPAKYLLKETRSYSYSERTEKNVVDSDGTLIISRGPLAGGSDYTRQMAVKHNRPWFHIDLSRTAAFHAATAIRDWILAKGLEVLNVAGPRASEDPTIYEYTLNILESVYYLGLVESNISANGNITHQVNFPKKHPEHVPQSVAEAVERLMSNMPLKDRITVANMSRTELAGLHSNLGRFIMDNFGLLSGNHELMKSCRSVSKDVLLQEEDAVRVIIAALWEKLGQTHKLRVVK